jgi:acyl transferase domain-containing protein/acyl carrier protein
MTAPVVPASGGDVAIIGMSGRFPRSPDLREFWRNISGGVECVSFFSPAELDAAGTPARLRDHPRYVPAQGALDGTDLFDAEFFGLNPKEAEIIDPQQRLLLECAWHAFEDSGRLPEDADGPVALFAGGYRNGYFELLGQSRDPYLSFLRDVGNEPDYMASRIAYLLGLTGAAVTVQTACSSSLVAVHLASRAVLAGECTTALAGGVTVRAAEGPGYIATEGGIYSSDGHCRSFDAAAEGTVIGEGVGLVVLKRLDRALADGDRVRAVIKGSALGNDGSARVGYTAPGVAGQARIVAAALAAADVHPDTVGYVEAHGSGTPMGDRIEVDALTRAYRERGWRAGQRPIGSVKTNIGHTHAAAGIAGLLKTVLALEHRLVPPSLHLDRPNPQIDFAASPFAVAQEAMPWPRGEDPRRAGVSSFGLGGTGAHVVLEEAPAPAPRPTADGGGRRWQLLTVSARSEAAGAAQCRALADRLGEPDAADLADAAWTLHTGRRAFAHRRFAVADSPAAAVAALADPDALPGVRIRSGSTPSVAFLLPGLGDQHIGMARRIRDTEPVFRAELDRCADILGARDGLDLLGALYPANAAKDADPAGGGGLDLRAMLGRGRRSDDLPDTRLAQPAVFAVEYALARLWAHWGVRADALLGYSIGEFTAACLAGVLGLEDALHLVAERARLLAALPGGSMLAVPLGEERLRELLLMSHEGGPAAGPGRVAVAAVNGPELCVAAGPADQVQRLAEQLAADGIPSRPVQTTHAFHTPMMRPAAAGFAALVASLDLGEPRIPLLSNVTGDWMTPEQAVDPGHWVRHLCEPVRFAQSAARLWDLPGRVLLEVGPGRALGSLALQARPPGAAEGVQVLASLPARHEREPEDRFLLTTAGRLWQAGVRLDWTAFHAGERRARTPLPGYPFERRRHWPVPAAGDGAPGPADAAAAPAPARADGDVAGWFSVPGWRQLPPLTARVTPAADEPWLIFLDPAGIGGRLSGELRRAGAAVRTVAPAGVQVPGEADHVLDPEDRDGYVRLLRAWDGPGRAARRIVHLWSVPGGPDTARDPDRAYRLGFGSLLLLAQALGEDGSGEPVRVTVVSAGLHAFGAGAGSSPEQAVLLGIRRVWPLENPAVGCRAVDLAPPAGADPARLARQVLAECLAGDEDEVVLRGPARYVQDMLPVPLPDGEGRRAAPVLREQGVYLITGGLGDLGLAVARHLAATVSARLVLTTRTPLPPPADSPQVRAVQELEKAGAQVLVVRSDAADAADMAAAVEQAVARFGTVHGAVHAAGVAGGGALQFRTPGAAAAVLAPKLPGARNLVDSLRPHSPDFIALFASTLGVTGAPGQADYCAANAYLDALAAHEQEREDGGLPVVAIDWDGWQELGMAAREGASRPTGHPLLGTLIEENARYAVYENRISAAADWLVDEHRMHGHPVVPGTGHLELARAAFVRHLPQPGGTLELDDISFFAPVVLAERETRTLRTVLEWDRSTDGGADGAPALAARFCVLSRREDPQAPWLRHCAGRIRRAPEPGPADPADPAELAGRLTEVSGAVHEGPMGFGPRSRCVKRIWSGPDETLAELELPEAFAADLDRLDLHPSLLDLANAYPGVFLAEEFRIPIAYGRMALHAPLPRRFFSHHRTTGSDHAGKATRTAEISLYAPDGRLLVRTEGFVLKHPGDLPARLESVRDGTAADLAPYQGPGSGEHRSGGPRGLAGHLERTIAPEQGLQALVRVLDAGLRPQVVVAPQGLRRPAAAGSPADLRAAPAGAAQGRHPRPALTVAYRAPQGGLEERIAAFMGELLGVAEVGAHDPFLDLGGHSLLALQLLSRLRQEFGTSIPLGEFFDSLTAAGLAGRLAAESV